MEGESGVTRRISDELLSWEIQRDQMGGEGGVSRSINDELQSLDMLKWKLKVLLLKV